MRAHGARVRPPDDWYALPPAFASLLMAVQVSFGQADHLGQRTLGGTDIAARSAADAQVCHQLVQRLGVIAQVGVPNIQWGQAHRAGIDAPTAADAVLCVGPLGGLCAEGKQAVVLLGNGVIHIHLGAAHHGAAHDDLAWLLPGSAEGQHIGNGGSNRYLQIFSDVPPRPRPP